MSPRKRFNPRSALPGSPFLTHVALREDRVQPGVHPFTVPWLLPSLDLQLSAPATFLVGENGTGKSTLLEAIAWSVGFGAQGGNRDQSFAENADGHALGRALRLSWRQKVSGGFFLRAETFFCCTSNPTGRHSFRCFNIASSAIEYIQRVIPLRSVL